MTKVYWAELYNSTNTYQRNFQFESSFGITDSINGGQGQMSFRIVGDITDLDINYSDRIKVYVADKETDSQTIFSGWVSTITPATFGKYVDVVALGFVAKLDSVRYMDGLNTVIEHQNTELKTIFEDIMTKARDNDTSLPPNFENFSDILTTGVEVDYDANNLTIYQALNKYIGFSPAYWFWHLTPNDNLELKSKYTTALHYFYKGKDLIDFQELGKVEGLINTVVVQNKQSSGFVGKWFQNYNSVKKYTRFTESVIDDRIRYETTAQAKADKILQEKSQPLYEFKATIADSNGSKNGYDIESINVGDTAIVFDYDFEENSAIWDSTGVYQKWSSAPSRIWDSTGVYTKWGIGNWDSTDRGDYFWGVQASKRKRIELIISQKTYYPDRLELTFQTRPKAFYSMNIENKDKLTDEQYADIQANSIDF